MKVGKSFGVLALGLLTLSACGPQEPSFTHALELSDGTGVVTYNCAPLEGAEATAALKAAHRLYERKFHRDLTAHNAMIRDLRATGGMSQEEIIAINAKTRAKEQSVLDATAALGCEYKGGLF